MTGFGAGSIDKFSSGKFIYNGEIYIDDPLKLDDANSNVMREGCKWTLDETIKSRKNTCTTPVVIVMQRLHEDDFVGKFLSNDEFD